MNEQDNEVEALLGKFYEVSKREFSGDAVRAGVVAVRDAVLASLAALAGGLDMEEVRSSLECIARSNPVTRELVLEHMAAQGRANAALQQEVSGWLSIVMDWQAASMIDKGSDPDGVTPDDLRADLARRDAEAAALKQRAEQAEQGHAIAREQRRKATEDMAKAVDAQVRAETALATLRQAFANTERRTDRFDGGPCWCEPYARSGEDAPHDAHCTRNRGLLTDATPAPAEHPAPRDERWATVWEALECVPKEHGAVAQAADAALTSLEAEAKGRGVHPDTAALRAIRERAGDAPHALYEHDRKASDGRWCEWDAAKPHVRAAYADSAGAVVSYLLGDSGPSGDWECCAGGNRDVGCGSCPGPTPVTPETVALVRNALGLPPDGPSRGGEERCDHHRNPDCRHTADEIFTERPAKPAETLRTHVDRAKEQRRAQEPAEADDWAEVETMAEVLERSIYGVSIARHGRAAIARLKQAPTKAAEAMRERCAALVRASGAPAVTEPIAQRIDALPLTE